MCIFKFIIIIGQPVFHERPSLKLAFESGSVVGVSDLERNSLLASVTVQFTVAGPGGTVIWNREPLYRNRVFSTYKYVPVCT